MFKLLFDVHQCSPVFFLLNIVYFSVCLTSNKLYWIEDQLADVSTRFYMSASWTVGELTGYRKIKLFSAYPLNGMCLANGFSRGFSIEEYFFKRTFI